MNSSIFTINTNDLVKGLILTVLSSVLTLVYDVVNAGSLVFDWKHIGTIALTSAIAYLLKNLLTNSAGQFLEKEKK